MRFIFERGAKSTQFRGIATFNVHPSLENNFTQPCPIASTHATEITRSELSNGSRVVTHDMDASNACVGIYVKAGAMYDPKKLPGMNYAFRWCFLGSNIENSIFQNDSF